MKKIVFLLAVVFVSATCENEIQKEKFGVIEIIKKDKDEIIPRENIHSVFADASIGRNIEISEEIKTKIKTYTEGAFNGEKDKFMDRAFKLYLKNDSQKQVFDRMYSRQNVSMKYNLLESHINYISRAVECDIMFAYVVENRTKFTVELLGENRKGSNTVSSELITRYGKEFVQYDPKTYTFLVDGSHVIYAVTPKDTLDMYFLDEITMHGNAMREFVSIENLQDLRRYFKEAPLYQR